MARYIDADWIAQRLDGWQDQLAKTYGENDEYVLCLGEVLMKIDDAPTADVRENVRAHWLKEEYFGGIFKCSNCGGYVDFRGLKGTQDPTKFCPNCGAQMDERREDNA